VDTQVQCVTGVTGPLYSVWCRSWMSQPTHAIRTGAATEAPEPLELIAGFPMSELVVRSDPRRSGRKQVTGTHSNGGLHNVVSSPNYVIQAPRAGTQRHRPTPSPAGGLLYTNCDIENRAIGGARPTRFPPGPISSHPEWVWRGPTEATRGPTRPEPR
jgi:hypothetical protein